MVRLCYLKLGQVVRDINDVSINGGFKSTDEIFLLVVFQANLVVTVIC
nr:hypothetical protein [Mucilaginibacter sp. FT3.2]